MRFKDIPQLTRSGNWECDFGLESFTKEIDRMVECDGLQLNPDFQRGNVWNEEQQIRYVEFFLKGGITARVVYLNKPSWRTSVEKNQYDDFVCVDGLQRIIAIKNFVYNEIKAFGYYHSAYEDTPRHLTHTMRINVNDLKTKKEVLQWYIDFNAGGTVHSNDEIEKVKKLLEQEERK